MAHVAVTTTLPVLDCLWLEKMTHAHAENEFNTLKNSPPQIPAKEARASFHLLTVHTKTVANTVREKPSSQTATMFTLKELYCGEALPPRPHTTLISASPPHSPSRCRRRSWLAVLGTSVIPCS